MTATIVQFDGSDSATAKTQLETLAPISTDKVVFWQVGSTVFVSKIKTS